MNAGEAPSTATAAAVATGATLAAPAVDLDALRRYRLGRVRAALAAGGIDLAVLTSPVSLLYAVDFDDYQLYQSRIPTFTLLVAADGPVTLFGAYNRGLPSVDEYLPGQRLSHFDAGLDLADAARGFARLLRRRLPGRARVAVERLDASVVQALMQVGFEVVDAGGAMESARSIKSAEELALLRHAIAVAELGIERMREALVPGITENALLAVLHEVNIRHGGRWTDGRMLASGPRTNPWLQEATDRVIAAGDLVAFDTDMIGPRGYFADVSRTLLCGDVRPSPAQRELYRRAFDEVQHDLSLVRAGVSFRELAERAFRQPPEFRAHRYPCLAHGAGMSDEWPRIAHLADWEEGGYDGVVEAGMVLCLESFVGRERGGEGVKLEQQVLVTETGTEPLSTAPFESLLLG